MQRLIRLGSSHTHTHSTKPQPNQMPAAHCTGVFSVCSRPAPLDPLTSPFSRSVRIVALGNEKGGFEESLQQPDLITTYFGRHAIIRHIEERRLLGFATHNGFPAFVEYQAYVFGRVRVLIHDCPSWVREQQVPNGTRLGPTEQCRTVQPLPKSPPHTSHPTA